MLRLEIKEKRGSKWEQVDLSSWRSAVDVELMLSAMDGLEFVCELRSGRTLVYLCGTQAMMNRMGAKCGKVMTFKEGIGYLREHRLIPKIVQELNHPTLLESRRVLGGQITVVEIAI